MFVIIVNQILKMLLLLLLGCLCFRMRLIDENGSKVLANLLLMVVNPMLAIVSLQTEYSAHLAQGLLVAYLLAFLTHLVAAILSTVLIRTTGNPDCGIDRFASMYSNCGFIGIPLVQSICENGDNGTPAALDINSITGQAFISLAQAVVTVTNKRNREMAATKIVEVKK